MTTPPPPGPQIFELPGPREVVSRGFDVIVAATSQIRQASVYIGFLVLLVTGPAIAFGAVFFAAAPESLVSDLAALAEEAERGVQPGPELGPWASSFLLLVFVGTTALVGVLVVSIEAQIMAVAILGGHVAGRPLQLREALIRSRQVFWRMVRAAFLVAIPVYLTQLVVTTALGPGSSPDPNVDLGGAGLLASFLGALVGMPFSYVPSAIVLGT